VFNGVFSFHGHKHVVKQGFVHFTFPNPDFFGHVIRKLQLKIVHI
jgi:hypothetical protein